MNDKISFHPETALGQVLLRWWEGLENNRGDRAELRRAHNLTAIVLTGGYQHLYQMLLATGWPKEDKPENNWRNERLAAIAGLLAHVKVQDERSLPLAMSEGERPPFSELRFRRLLDSSSLDEVFGGLRRALPLVSYQANVLELANDVLLWSDNVKKRWAYTYRWPAKSAV
ncbi:type I-E CRISPR-associated protein Cse2/CasB [Nitrosomonas communis]|uniref:type I-E CRISPR-associated protein Cse2/CasB n=1 Tax=Nitrosomonas communis TaxID=44574 RepID=UPI0026F2664B|nr:type I-E CRISPR-associated protein Cse2/CasB [Nitrosomonas communis]MCO6428714.1 type I-E CRISPR-associated protein Cse2/CasB [Nitrosomonas communis]